MPQLVFIVSVGFWNGNWVLLERGEVLKCHLVFIRAYNDVRLEKLLIRHTFFVD